MSNKKSSSEEKFNEELRKKLEDKIEKVDEMLENDEDSLKIVKAIIKIPPYKTRDLELVVFIFVINY
jgi:hypothetical protein